MNNKATVDQFLKKHGMHYDSIDLSACCQTFMEEMKAGLAGKTSSLLMLPTYISAEGEVPFEKPVIVMDAGGTNFRVAVVTFHKDREPDIDDFTMHPMPGTKGVLTKEEFFNTIVDYMEPVLSKSDKVGFCFSYPTDILPNKDGRLIHFNKEVRVDGMEGETICEGIAQALVQRGHADKKQFVLLNDSVATMLGGMTANPGRGYDSYIGFILGTGMNTCYLEQNKNITKAELSGEKTSSMVINMESGGYNRMPMGEFDDLFDGATNNPGNQRLEKMLSGAYQGGLIHLTVLKAIEEGLFSADFVTRYKELPTLTMRNIDDFCFYPYGESVLAQCAGNNEDDRLNLYFIIDASFERAARIAAINFAAILVSTGTGKTPTRPVCITAEGTTFYKSKLFKGKLDYYVKSFLNEQLGVYCEFIKAENATLVGTAVAALLN